jgi:benzoyl-CoA reductase/2-hydroxyglutaryl-CoA dehydratase subunit BcrC/BadD/HgdB
LGKTNSPTSKKRSGQVSVILTISFYEYGYGKWPTANNPVVQFRTSYIKHSGNENKESGVVILAFCHTQASQYAKKERHRRIQPIKHLDVRHETTSRIVFEKFPVP